ncbi:pyruvate kinase [Neorhizobium sp. LMR1-1-1.1]
MHDTNSIAAVDADERTLELGTLFSEVRALRDRVADEGRSLLESLIPGNVEADRLENLCHYLCLRRHDIRPLQRRLMCYGLSSLGRLESRVLPTLDAVLSALSTMQGMTSPYALPSEAQFFAGEAELSAMTQRLLGSGRPHRRGRIMVTLPGEAATDPDFILDLARRGMDVARINCAHDGADTWEAMARHVRAAGEKIGRRITVLMDIAGPKIRTEAVVADKGAKLTTGDLFRLVASREPYQTEDVRFCAAVSLPEIVERVEPGHKLRYNDGKLEAVVESVSEGGAILRVTRVKAGGVKLKPEKGLNLPDTALGLSPLTAKDEGDLAAVIGNADMLGYSFVSRPEDLDLLEKALGNHPPRVEKLGLVAKIEQPEAVRNLPALIARAHTLGRPFGVMIARGDLAAEIGFERVAEMQEEILWLCEAASVPTVWATQVLEDLVKDGLPSRGEMTDAAMAAHAECVMLNKGPAVAEAVTLLDTLLARMDEHIFKKTPTLRALKSW